MFDFLKPLAFRLAPSLPCYEDSVLKIMVLGIRGMPNVQGGVETHAEQLYTRLAAKGYEIEALVRTPFMKSGTRAFGQIKLRRIWSPRKSGPEALVHSVLGVIYAAFARPDILHIHSIGPAIVTPLARLAGLKVVVTYHSQNYEHEKWGRIARFVLEAGERLGMTYSNAQIAISKSVVKLIHDKYTRNAVLIPNGVNAVALQKDQNHVLQHGLQPGKYFLHVGRIASEKRQLDLIKAYVATKNTGWKLVLVGGSDDSDYSQAVLSEVSENVVQTGFLNGVALAQLYSHAGGFVLPSAHEGLPIALLEALSFGLPVLASDIAANTEIGLASNCYFRMGDINALSEGLEHLAARPSDPAARDARRQWVVENYDWDRVTEQTSTLYRSLIG